MNKKKNRYLTPVEKIEMLEEQEKIRKWNSPRFQIVLSLVLAFALTISSSIAYFTDMAQQTTQATIGTVQISLDDSDVNLLNANGMDILNPGDIRNVNFTVKNEGNKSADVKTIIKLTSSVPMTNNEYELYWSDSIQSTNGRGYKVSEWAIPLSGREISDDNMQITYTLDEETFSGNNDLDEYETEYEKGVYYLTDGEMTVTETIIQLPTDSGKMEDHYLYRVELRLPLSLDASTIIIPNMYEDRQIHYIYQINFYIDEANGIGIPENLTHIYMPKYTYMDLMGDLTGGNTVSEAKLAESGVTIHCYSADEALNHTSVPSITQEEYGALSSTEQASYVASADESSYDITLLFSPNAGNEWQNSTVTITIEVYAKQHRNTNEDMWSLVESTTVMSLRDGVFTVDYDEEQRLTLTGIVDSANFNSLTEIVIPEGVEVIPDEFFYGCTNIESVTLPSSIKEIGDYAFYGCSNLTTINLPDNIEIGIGTFDGCPIE